MDEAPPRPAPDPAPDPALASLALPLLVSLGVSAVVTLVSALAPDKYAATAVGVCFLAATWWLVLRKDAETVRAFGLSLGGLLEPSAIDARRMIRDTLVAVAWALALSLVIFPPFWIGYRVWWHPRAPFAFKLPPSILDDVAGQLVVIALPEEAFFRGYLQTAIDRARPPKLRILGAEVGLGLALASLIFAVGHVLTIRHPARLAVFFPALVFGWLRARTKGVGAGVLFHALCNLFASILGRGYGLS